MTRRGAVVRSDGLDRLTPAAWEAVEAYGIRTIIDLRNDDEREPGSGPRPAALTTLSLPHDPVAGEDFWNGGWGDSPEFATPAYYAAHIERFPERSARVLAAIADAAPGGVVVHCAGGRDRTGLISILLLALAGVETAAIVADYELSDERLPPFWAERGMGDQKTELDRYLAGRGTSAAELIVSLVESVDLEGRMRDGGLTDADLSALRARLAGP